jgi:hypothetical protein
MKDLFAIACSSLPRGQNVVAVVLPLVQEGGRDNLERELKNNLDGKLDRRGRNDVLEVQ